MACLLPHGGDRTIDEVPVPTVRSDDVDACLQPAQPAVVTWVGGVEGLEAGDQLVLSFLRADREDGSHSGSIEVLPNSSTTSVDRELAVRKKATT